MKKIDITSQLIILLVAVLLIACCIFSLTTVSFAREIARKETNNKLSTYAILIDNNFRANKGEDFPEIDMGYYCKTTDTVYQQLNDMGYYVTVKDVEDVINNLKDINNNKKLGKISFYSKKINGSRINFSVITDDGMETYTLVFTDDSHTTAVVREITLKINGIFVIVMLLAIVVIYFWSNNIARRLRKIQNHILSLPKNEYKTTYLDTYEDEVGDLSKSIEVMRSEICENERIKQEMLHNLSHDFKTPIAVIKTYAEAIQDGVEDVSTSTNKIIEQSDLLKKKVNRLIEYNRLEYFNSDKEFEDIKIADIIYDIILNYKHQLENIEFITDINEDVTFKGISENWYTVIDNIIDNAKRYAKSQIKIVLRPGRLRIYNDGDHIDEKFIESAFKPYEKGNEGQFGLGMSIVQKTVDYFNMNLHVVNEEVGVSFIIDDKIEEK